jgi:hypothetical protein
MADMSKTPSLFRLVYASHMSGACLGDLDRELPAILSVAIPNNRALGVTGILIAHRGWFLQALEGEETTVRSLYGDICADPRHRSEIIIGQGDQVARRFGRWTMCARALSPRDAAVLGALDRKSTFDPATFPERAVLKLLEAVADVHAQSFNVQQAVALAAA